MKRRQGIILLFVVFVSSFSSPALFLNFSHANPSEVSEEDMKSYAETFLGSYNEELLDEFGPKFWKYFPLYSNYTHLMNITMSDSSGAALEFTPWNQEIYDYKTIKTQVESTIFRYIDLNVTSVANSTGYKVIVYTGGLPYGPFITVRSNGHAFLSDDIIVTNKASFTKVEEGGELFLSNVIVDGRHFHTLIMRGSGELSAWTTGQAKADAHMFFENDLYRAFNQSEEFRKLLAYPELSELLAEIIWKHLHEEEYDLDEFKEDLAKVRDLARDKYHVSTEFVDEVLDYLEKKAMTPFPSPWWEVAPWSWVLAGLVVFVLEEVIRRGYKRWLAPKPKKSKRKRRSRKKKARAFVTICAF